MPKDIKLKRLCQREPAQSLIQSLLRLSPSPVTVADSEGMVLLTWPGLTECRSLPIPVAYPIHADKDTLLGIVSGGREAAVLADFIAFLAQKDRESRQLAQETLSKYKELTLLYELGEKIAACVDETQLAELAVAESRALLPQGEDLGIGVMLADDVGDTLRVAAGQGQWFPLNQRIERMDGITRQVWIRGVAEIVNQLETDRRYQDDPGALTDISALLCVPLKTRERLFGVLSVVSLQPLSFSAADLKVMNLLASQIATALGRIHLIRIRVEQERLEEALKLARSIQMNMLPTAFPRFSQSSPIDLYACMEPAREVSGDFYDFFPLDSQTLLIVIGDVSDKGMPAALFMVMVKTLIRAHAKTCRSPRQILTAVNPELCRDNDALMFVTLFIATLDLENGRLIYSFGGHQRPLLLDVNGSVHALPGETGTALGIIDTLSYTDQERVLRPGETLLLYTDGVSEAMNTLQEEFGDDRLYDVLAGHIELDAEQRVERVLSAVAEFTVGAEQSDDITLLAVKRA